MPSYTLTLTPEQDALWAAMGPVGEGLQQLVERETARIMGVQGQQQRLRVLQHYDEASVAGREAIVAAAEEALTTRAVRGE